MATLSVMGSGMMWRQRKTHLIAHPAQARGMPAPSMALVMALEWGMSARAQELIAGGANANTRDPAVGFMSTCPGRLLAA